MSLSRMRFFVLFLSARLGGRECIRLSLFLKTKYVCIYIYIYIYIYICVCVYIIAIFSKTHAILHDLRALNLSRRESKLRAINLAFIARNKSLAERKPDVLHASHEGAFSLHVLRAINLSRSLSCSLCLSSFLSLVDALCESFAPFLTTCTQEMRHHYATHMWYCTATHCNTLQHTAPNCTLRARNMSPRRHTCVALHCNTLQRSATHYTALHFARKKYGTNDATQMWRCIATHCNTLHFARKKYVTVMPHVCGIALQHIPTQCNTLHFARRKYFTMTPHVCGIALQRRQHIATHCNTLQHIATHGNT